MLAMYDSDKDFNLIYYKFVSVVYQGFWIGSLLGKFSTLSQVIESCWNVFFFLILFIIIKTLKISTLFYIRHPKVVSVQETTFNFIKVLSLMFLFFWIAYKIDFTDKICNCILLLLLHRSRYFLPHFKFPFHQRFHQLIFIVHFIFEKKKKTIYIEFKNIVSNSTRNCNV